MGLYDNFVTTEKIICPACKQELESKDSDHPDTRVLQSKALDCSLDTYRQSEPIQLKSTEKNFFIKDGWIEAHTVCDKCNTYVKFKLMIENSIWTRTEAWEED